MALLKCPLCCEEEFDCNSSLKYHILSVIENLFCPVCNERCENLHDLAEHVGSDCRKEEENMTIEGEVEEEVEEEDVSSNNVKFEILSDIKYEDVADVGEETPFLCQICNIHIKSVEEHLEEFHAGEEIIVNRTNQNDVKTAGKSQPPFGNFEIPFIKCDIEEVISNKTILPNNNNKTIQNALFEMEYIRSKKKRTLCKFCKQDVTNFERHLQRSHRDEIEVVEIMNLPIGSKIRKQRIGLLRKSSHFDKFLTGAIRPAYSKKNIHEFTGKDYYPCANCKGLYLKKYLNRHGKDCCTKSGNDGAKRLRHLATSQTLIACALEQNDMLTNMRVSQEVFSTMKADDISLVVKRDKLICYFGEYFLNNHKCKKLNLKCSNRMRELARLLIELREASDNDLLTLADALHPFMYKKMIECCKKIAGYDQETKSYLISSLPLHIGTSLKQASDILADLITKGVGFYFENNKERKIEELQQFRNLITKRWNNELFMIDSVPINEEPAVTIKIEQSFEAGPVELLLPSTCEVYESTNVVPTKPSKGRTPWSKDQINIVRNYFKNCIENRRIPKKKECQELIDKYPILFRNKDWTRIKIYVYNAYRLLQECD